MSTVLQRGPQRENMTIMDQQVEDLKERMRLLQHDRRANLEFLEANKASNTEEVRQLREENKALRSQLTKLQKKGSSSKADIHVLGNLQKEMLGMRTEYDALRVQSNKCKLKLDKLKDEARICNLEDDKRNHEDSPLSRQIRTLENRLDKAMIKYNEAQTIKRTYEHIVRRLKEERVSYDNQLRALETTLQSKQKDCEELILLSGDANHARDLALQELNRERHQYEANRIKRDTELRERQQLVKVRKQMIDRQAKREARRRELIEKQILQDELAASNAATDQACLAADEATIVENERKIDIYEAAFRKIKSATGVSDVNEVIYKVSGQEETSENLIQLTKTNQEKIEELTSERERLKEAVNDVKYNTHGQNQRRTEIERLEHQLQSSSKELESLKAKHERLDTTFINVKGGVRHLQSKLEYARQSIGMSAITLTDSSIVAVLESIDDLLQHMIIKIKDHDDETLLMADYNDNKDQTVGNSMIDNFDLLNGCEIFEDRPFNQRINVSAMGDDEDAIKAFDPLNDDGMNIELDDDECDLSRDRIKRFSSQIVVSENRKSRAKSNNCQ